MAAPVYARPAPKHAAPVGQYTEMKLIGKGTFGRVSLIKRNKDGKTLVWKEIEYGRMKEAEKQLIVSEVNILRELKHPNIVSYLDRIIDKERHRIFIVMEHCAGGDLRQLISKYKHKAQPVQEDFIWRCFSQIVSALCHCHRRRVDKTLRPILHRDLKPANILLDAHNNVKIGDFGLAKQMAGSRIMAQTNVGTPFYMAPEITEDKPYNAAADIWAVGCIIYEMAALHPPFQGSNALALAQRIHEGKFQPLPPMYSQDLHKIVGSMLQRDPARRPLVRTLEAHDRVRAYAEAQLRAQRAQQQQQQQQQQQHGVQQESMERLKQLEQQHRKREAELQAREVALKQQEGAVRAREKKVEQRERDLDRRERSVKRKEAALAGGSVAAGAGAVAPGTGVGMGHAMKTGMGTARAPLHQLPQPQQQQYSHAQAHAHPHYACVALGEAGAKKRACGSGDPQHPHPQKQQRRHTITGAIGGITSNAGRFGAVPLPPGTVAAAPPAPPTAMEVVQQQQQQPAFQLHGHAHHVRPEGGANGTLKL